MKIHPIINSESLNGAKIASRSAKPAASFQDQLEAISPMFPGKPPLRSLDPMDMQMLPGLRGFAPQQLQPLEAPKAALNPMNELDFIPGVKGAAPKSENEQITDTARKWVAQTFFGTLLKQMRDSPWKSEIFDGGRGGQAFSPMLDAKLAERMARASDKKLVRSIVRKLEKKTRADNVLGLPDAGEKSQSQTPKDSDFNKVRIHVAPSLGT